MIPIRPRNHNIKIPLLVPPVVDCRFAQPFAPQRALDQRTAACRLALWSEMDARRAFKVDVEAFAWLFGALGARGDGGFGSGFEMGLVELAAVGIAACSAGFGRVGVELEMAEVRTTSVRSLGKREGPGVVCGCFRGGGEGREVVDGGGPVETFFGVIGGEGAVACGLGSTVAVGVVLDEDGGWTG